MKEFVNQTLLTEKEVEYITFINDVYNIWKCLGYHVYRWESTSVMQIPLTNGCKYLLDF